MGDFVFNIAKGRVTELVNRVNLNDPANSVVIVAVWNAGAATDATLKDYTTHAAVEADANAAEVTNTGYARKVLNDTSGMTVTTDQTNDRVDVDMPDQTSTAGTDANVVPMTWHDFIVTPDGSDIVAQVNAAGFFRAA
jgi:hypothetical protein